MAAPHQRIQPTDVVHVTVRLGEPLWRLVGERRLTLSLPSGGSVADVLEALVRRAPALRVLYEETPRRTYQVFVNARHVPWDKLAEHPISDGDTLYIFPPAAGGEAAGPPLPRAFYEQPTLRVAQALLGCYLVREYRGQRLVGRILETEAYVGPDDQASHASVGKTQRNAVMFGPAGHAYVYVIYGIHHCLNVVTERPGYPAAVLIRALEPVAGIEIMRQLRGGRPDRELANGPGKLCQALAIDRRFNGHDLCAGRDLWIAAGEPVPDDQIVTGPRVGVRGDERALRAPWRFAIRGHPGVSKPYPW